MGHGLLTFPDDSSWGGGGEESCYKLDWRTVHFLGLSNLAISTCGLFSIFKKVP
jgi:hypothetical protein